MILLYNTTCQLTSLWYNIIVQAVFIANSLVSLVEDHYEEFLNSERLVSYAEAMADKFEKSLVF